MTAPRLEIDLDKIFDNAQMLVAALNRKGIGVTGVTKSVQGWPEIARVFVRAGVQRLGDARIENVEKMRNAGLQSPVFLIRSPMISQAKRVVREADVSFNTEIEVIRALSAAAVVQGAVHGVVLMVELGDLREGIMPGDLIDTVRRTINFPGIELKGIGTNLACRSGVCPDERNMSELSNLANSVEDTFDRVLDIVSGGNSANIEWALSGADTGRVNDLRLGEAILFGREALQRRPIAGLHTDAISVVAEIIESKEKPSRPWGTLAQNAFGETSQIRDRGMISQALAAIGRHDIDPIGLVPRGGIEILGASSDHLILDAGKNPLPVGSEVTFDANYSSLIRAMVSPSVTKFMKSDRTPQLPC